MKKLLFLVLAFLSFLDIYSQDTIVFAKEKNTKKDVIIFDLFNDFWQDAPSVVNLRSINQGISVSAMINKPIGYSNFSLAFGLGLSSHNMYSDAVPVLGRDINNKPDGTVQFIKLGNYANKTVEYNINKLNVTYIDIPVEIKFITRSEKKKTFRSSLGFKFGYNISNHTKYRGEDYIEETDDYVTIKKSNIKYINNWHYGIIARVGYGKYNLMAYYSLSKLFEKGKLTDNNKEYNIYPISIGISFIPF